MERSALEQKDEIHPFSNQNKTSALLRGQARNDVAGGINFKRMVHVCEETVSTFISIVQQHIPVLGLSEGKVVKQVPGLDQCQEYAKDQELNFAGTELRIEFAIVTLIEVTVVLVQNADFHIKNLCPHIQKMTPIMIQM